MQPPTVYLLNRGMTEDKMQRVRELLSITPLQAIVILTPQDADYARRLDLPSEITRLLHRPIAIIGDFEADCTALGEGQPCRLL